MKIYDIKSFLVALIAFGAAAFELFRFDGAKSAVWIFFFLYMGIRLLRSSLSEEATAMQAELEERDEKVRRELMGPLWRFPEYIALGLCLVGVVLYGVLWRSDWGGILLFVCFAAAMIFALWFNVKYRTMMEREQQNQDDTKP